MSEIDDKNHAIDITIKNDTDFDMIYYSHFFNPGRMEEGTTEGTLPDRIKAREAKTLRCCNHDNDPVGVRFKLEYVVNEERLTIETENYIARSNKIGVMTDEDKNFNDPVDDHNYELRTKNLALGNRYFAVDYKCSGGSKNVARVEIRHDVEREREVAAKMSGTAQALYEKALKARLENEQKVETSVRTQEEAARAALDKFQFHLDQIENRTRQDDTIRIDAFDFRLTQDELNRAAPYDLAIYADTVTIGGDLRFPAKNLFVSARVIRLSSDSHISTSVDDGALRDRTYFNRRKFHWHDYSNIAQGRPDHGHPSLKPANAGAALVDSHRNLDGKHGGNGVAGLDGSDGIHAGNVTLLTDQLDYAGHRLSVSAVGGRGGRGQDGGQGGDGGNGSNIWGTQRVDDSKRLMPKWKVLAHNVWWPHQRGRGGWAGNGGAAGKSGAGGNGGSIFIGIVRPAVADVNTTPTLSVVGGLGGAAAAGSAAGKPGGGDPMMIILDQDNGGKETRVNAPNGRLGVAGAAGAEGVKGADGRVTVKQIAHREFYAGNAIERQPTSSVDQWRIAFRAAKAAYLHNHFGKAKEVFDWLSVVLGIADMSSTGEANVPDDVANLITALSVQVETRLKFLDMRLDYFGRSFEYVPVVSLKECEHRTETILKTTERVEGVYREVYDLKRLADRDTESGKQSQLTLVSAIKSGEKDLATSASVRPGIERRLQELTDRLAQQNAILHQMHTRFVSAMQRGQQTRLFTSVLSLTAQTVMVATGSYAAARLVGLAGTSIGAGVKALDPLLSSDNQLSKSPITKHLDAKFAKLVKTAESLEKESKGQKDKSEVKKDLKPKKTENGDRGDETRMRALSLPAIPSVWVDEPQNDPVIEIPRPRFYSLSSAEDDAAPVMARRVTIAALPVREAASSGRPRAATMPALATISSSDNSIADPTGSKTNLVAKGTSTILQVVPIIEELGDVIQLGSDLANLQDQFGFDAVKVAIDKDRFEKLTEKALSYVEEKYVTALKSAFDTYAQIARERNDLLIEYQANYLKSVEADAKLCQARFEAALLRSRMASMGQERAVALHAHWQAIYDAYRDLALDCIYDEYRAFRYYALQEAGFDSSITEMVSQPSSRKAAKEIAAQFGEYATNQNAASLRDLHSTVMEHAFAARKESFAAKQNVRNRSITFTHDAGCLDEIRRNGKVDITFSPDNPELADLARLYISSIKILLPGLHTSNGRVCIELTQSGSMLVRDLSRSLHAFRHDSITNQERGNVADYIYRMVPVSNDNRKPEEKPRTVITDEEFYYVEIEAPYFEGEKRGYIDLSPFATWTIRLPEDKNSKMDTSKLRSIIVYIVGTGIAIRSKTPV